MKLVHVIGAFTLLVVIQAATIGYLVTRPPKERDKPANMIGVSMEWPEGVHVECGWRHNCFGELAAVCGAYMPEYRRQSIYGGLLR